MRRIIHWNPSASEREAMRVHLQRCVSSSANRRVGFTDDFREEGFRRIGLKSWQTRLPKNEVRVYISGYLGGLNGSTQH